MCREDGIGLKETGDIGKQMETLDLWSQNCRDDLALLVASLMLVKATEGARLHAHHSYVHHDQNLYPVCGNRIPRIVLTKSYLLKGKGTTPRIHNCHPFNFH